MKSPKRKRISDAKAGVLILDQVKAAISEETALRFDLSKGVSRLFLPPEAGRKLYALDVIAAA